MSESCYVGLVSVGRFSQASFPFCGLAAVVEQVALKSMSAFYLAVFGYFKAFFRSRMCFQLWHCCFLLILALQAARSASPALAQRLCRLFSARVLQR